MNLYKTSDFSFELPQDLIAQQPMTRRDACRMLHLTRVDGRCVDRVFSDLVEILEPGDLLVLNDTRVLPGRFFARRLTGGRIEGLFLEVEPSGAWRVLLKGAGRCRPGEALTLGRWRLDLLEKHQRGQWTLRVDPDDEPQIVLEAEGVTPLPPYIHRREQAECGDAPQDREAYQTVYARRSGAVAAPTAGLHFTSEMLDRLASRGVDRTFVTLHVGLGTFLPVTAESLQDHRMHSEWYEMSREAAEAINAARAAGRRVIAVGTTAVRVLETVGRARGCAEACGGRTDIFIYPPSSFVLTDALITNFHLPESTLVMLVAAFCDPGGTVGREMILHAYAHAVEQRYRFFSYGDAMFIE